MSILWVSVRGRFDNFGKAFHVLSLFRKVVFSVMVVVDSIADSEEIVVIFKDSQFSVKRV